MARQMLFKKKMRKEQKQNKTDRLKKELNEKKRIKVDIRQKLAVKKESEIEEEQAGAEPGFSAKHMENKLSSFLNSSDSYEEDL